MGSVTCRLSSSKAAGPEHDQPAQAIPHSEGLVRRISLRRTLSKAKDAFHRPKLSYSSGVGAISQSVLAPQDQTSPEGMQSASRLQRQEREVIEIPDDDDDDDDSGDDIISLDSLSDGRGRSGSSNIECLSNPESLGQNQSVLDDYDSPRPESPDDGEWGYEIPRPDTNAAVAQHFFGHREDDWREFIEDGNAMNSDDREAEQDPILGFGHRNFNEAVNHNLPRSALADAINPKVACVDDVLTVFPDICRDYVSELYDTGVGETAETLIAHILDNIDSGTEYPRAKDKIKTLKRKRELDEDEEAANKYGSIDRESGSHGYATLTRNILSGEFPQTPMVFIDATLNQTRHHLFPAYRVLEEAERTWDPVRPPYNKIKKPRTTNACWTPEKTEATLNSELTTPDTVLALRELQAARRARKKAADKRQAERQAELDEEENFRKAEAEGTMVECGCCFGDYPQNRMVHCDNEWALHWFCRGCARQMAENEIGNSKYKIKCMSMDGCESGFSRDMKNQFLDEKALIALDRNEQEEMLRMAGIENLASCPFCPFAAEYPPVEEDRLFRCQAPDCEKVSCRLCKLESHIPKTCAENAKDNGLSVRRQIEEAMSAALIRKCNKCGTPFVKEEGCNKMTCTRGGCYNVQCYVCSKSCSYDHFNDRTRGGKPGNCPLFESVEERHQEEVRKAEKEALAKVRAEHPEYTEDDLKVKVSENVRKDEERRRSSDPRLAPPGVIHGIPPAGLFPQPGRVGGHGGVRRPPARPPEARPLQVQGPPPVLYAPDRNMPLLVQGIHPMAGIPDPNIWFYGPDGNIPPPGLGARPGVPVENHPAWLYGPDGDIPGFDDMLGLFPPANAADLAAFPDPLNFIGAERHVADMAVPPRLEPAAAAQQYQPPHYPDHGGGFPGMDEARRQRLNQQRQRMEQLQAQAAHGQPVPPRPGNMPLRLSPRRPR